jgi:uncharacterized protein (TIGR03083 family)
VLDLTPMLAPERATLLELLRGLTDEQWALPTECPEWDVKGVALHILGDDLSLLSRQRDVAPQGLILYAQSNPGLNFRQLLDGFNEQWVTASAFLSPALMIELLRLVGEWSDDFYCSVGLETMSREPVGLFAATKPSPYWQLIAREYLERVVHQSQIRRAVGAPELDGELVTAVARVISHILAVHLTAFAPATGAAVALTWGTAGTWTLQRDENSWTATEGAANPDAHVTFAPEIALRVITRGVSSDEVSAGTTIEGNAELGRGVLDHTAPLLTP